MSKQKKDPISRLSSQLSLFSALLLVIFCVELLIMFVILPMLFGGVDGIVANIADSVLLALLRAPCLWLLIIRPLRDTAMQERAWGKTVLGHVVDGVAILTEEGVIESFNPAAERIFGYASPEVTGMAMKRLLLEGDLLADKLGESRNGNCEAVGRRKDGCVFPLDLSTSKVLVRDRSILICIMRDITDRKRAEQEIHRLNAELVKKIMQLQESQENLVRKEKLAILGQLAGSVGHELRNPLGVMNNAVYFLQLVLSDANETTKEYLGIIKQEIDNSQHILTDLLDFARTKSPQKRMVKIPELVAECVSKCTVPEKIEMRIVTPDDLPALSIDPLQMQQVLQNLMTNGIQAMPHGGALRIVTRLVGAGLAPAQSGYPQGVPLQDFIEIRVEDTGEGISPEGMTRLFQPLFTTKPKGIGLGLVVCKNLVEANGGRIEVESVQGEGTTFTLLLPIAREGV